MRFHVVFVSGVSFPAGCGRECACWVELFFWEVFAWAQEGSCGLGKCELRFVVVCCVLGHVLGMLRGKGRETYSVDNSYHSFFACIW